jgi:hypothetical protein
MYLGTYIPDTYRGTYPSRYLGRYLVSVSTTGMLLRLLAQHWCWCCASLSLSVRPVSRACWSGQPRFPTQEALAQLLPSDVAAVPSTFPTFSGVPASAQRLHCALWTMQARHLSPS